MVLAIDTCGPTGGVALGEVLADDLMGPRMQLIGSREVTGRTFSELLLSSIAEMLAESQVAWKELTGIAVVHGPGSFTGIRIGVSAAKGLAEGLNIPVMAISRLKLLVDKADGDAIAALDAGRGEFFVGEYRNDVRVAESLMNRESLLQTSAGSGLPLLICEAKLKDALAGTEPQFVSCPTAADALRAGARRFPLRDFDDVSTLDAHYLRRSETEMLARIAEHAALRAAGK